MAKEHTIKLRPKPSSVIYFYRVTDDYGCFSNFAPYPIKLRGKVWPTTEHYFQAQKFTGTEHEEEIRQASSPLIAARKGRERHRPIRPDWESVRDEIMREALWAKFTQHVDLQHILLSTGDAQLVEHTVNDMYWADGGDGTGNNMLGKLLMLVRADLQI